MATIDDDGNVIANPDGTLVEGDPGGGGSAGYQGDVNLSNKTFRYNPPLHNSSNFMRVDFGDQGGIHTAKFYDEKKGSYKEEWAHDGLNTLRLGRIIQHYLVPGQAGTMEHRWGFRFLYNPTSISYVSSRNDSFVIDPRSEANRVLSGVFQNFQAISFTVLLDRTPDVLSGIPSTAAYSPSLNAGDKAGILRYGTHWDMEALLKIANGEWDLTDRGKTSNIGVLMPSNARLILGPGINFYGFIGEVTWADELFSPDMVPIRTRLDIVFRRHVDMTAQEAEDSFPGIAESREGNPDEDSDSDGPGPGSGNSDPGGGDTGRTDSGIPSGYKNGRSTGAAVTYALSRVGRNEMNGYCLQWVSNAFQPPQSGKGIQEAHQVWDNAPHSIRHSRDFSPPRGSLVLWSAAVGRGNGHIAIALGNGNMVTTWPSGVTVMPIKNFSQRAYLGWMPPYFTNRRQS